jgi:hypothetical protein
MPKAAQTGNLFRGCSCAKDERAMAGFGIGKYHVISFDPDIDGRDANNIYIKDMVARLHQVMLREMGGDVLTAFGEGNLGCEHITITCFHTTHSYHSPASESIRFFMGPGLCVARAMIR